MIFVDTTAWLALVDQRDGNHVSAVRFRAELARGVHGQLITTDHVLDETASLIKRRAGAGALQTFRAAVEGSSSVHVVWTSPAAFWAAWDRLAKSRDKDWSLTDCISFQTMESLSIRKSFGYDTDFVQAGFTQLPSSSH